MTAVLIEAAIALALEKTVDGIKEPIADHLRSRAAKRELAKICQAAIVAAAGRAPALREDLGSASFVEGVVAPTVLTLLSNPLIVPDSAGLAKRFIDMFVARYAKNDDVDAALKRLFQTDRPTLEAAFIAFFETLKFSLAGSERWRVFVTQQTGEAALRNTGEILRILRAAPAEGPVLDLATATRQAATASLDLVEWPRDIFGATIERPEFKALKNGIKSSPSGRTLLVGIAGSGKSALLSTLTENLAAEGVAVLAIKADRLPADVRTLEDVASALGMTESIDATVRRLADSGPVVVLIDQLDAVSDVMDRKSSRMSLLLRLVANFHPQVTDAAARLPVHVIVSSRPFEADHDARFLQLDAERLTLALPSKDQVDALLHGIGVSPDIVPEAMRETVRRPFALKLFVDLVRRGLQIDDLLPGELLARWLETANLGDAAMRPRVAQFLTDLAADMIEAETLWRPVDRYALHHLDELRLAEACGLLVRNERGQVAFSHQSWLDDFQAKGFTSGRALAEYAWESQNSLFPRAAVLRALQRLRAVDEPAYVGGIDLLLGDDRTRRHLKHLVTDLISGAEPPVSREIAWVEFLLRNDAALARRALPHIIRSWGSWRDKALAWLPSLMSDEGMQWFAPNALAAEAAFDEGGMMDLMDHHWGSADKDELVLRTIERSDLWTPRIRTRVREIMGRTTIANHFIAHRMRELLDAERVDEAVDFVASYYETGELSDRLAQQVYELGELVAAAPEAFAARLFERFVTLAQSEVRENSGMWDRMPESSALPWDWRYEDRDDNFFEALRSSLRLTAKQSPDRLVALIEPYEAVEISQIQAMIVDALAAGGEHLAIKALSYLEADPRRLDLGDGHGTGTDGIGRTIQGWSSQALVRAIVPGLDQNQLVRLRNLIEGWSRYSPQVLAGVSKADWRQFYQWADEARLPLLESLPKSVVGARRRRQIEEWRSQQPVMRSMNRIGMANVIGSPMSNLAMEKASDDQLMGMLDSVHDGSEERWNRGRPYTGGVRQLAYAFGAFAGANPERALGLVENRMVPERHTSAAGAALREAAKAPAADPERVRALIHTLDSRGYQGPGWRNNAAWAFSSLAERLHGLRSEDLALLERWIEREPDVIAQEIERRLDNKRENEERNRKNQDAARRPNPHLFYSYGGMRSIPQRNYSFLAAIADGLLGRTDPDCSAWVGVMERHLADPEDPAIWSAMIQRYANPLWWVERERAVAFFSALWEQHPDSLTSPDMVGEIWQVHSLMAADVIEGVISKLRVGDAAQRQVAGELLGGIMLVDKPVGALAEFAQDIVASGPSLERVGYLFSASAAWQEDEHELRQAAHAILLAVAPSVDDDEAHALTRAVGSRSRPLPADQITREMLRAIGDNPKLLVAAVGNAFVESLQGLLLCPGFESDVLVVVDKIAKLSPDTVGRQGRILDGELVHIAVALQRNDGPLRVHAMDVYERLLDAEAYGAAEAAEAALVRKG